jgi:hypothetical protein
MLNACVSRRLLSLSVFSVVALVASARASAAVPPTPSGPHPRMFMSASELANYQSKVSVKSSGTASIIAECQHDIDTPADVMDRGGADGGNWPAAAVACAFSYAVTHNTAHLTAALKFWNATLNDDQTMGDNKGCVAGVNTNWQGWDGYSTAAPPVIATVTHDTGYPIRWYGPDLALTYDWLHDAPGVTEALRAQTRTCLTNWVDWYTSMGYHNDEAGSNYNAGWVVAKAFTAVAFGGENGAAGDRLWTETINDVFGSLIIGKGLAGATGAVGSPAGVMVGGDWGEGWQYGPLSVLHYAAAARAMESAGASLPEMDAWVNSLIVRYIHGTVPKLDGHFNANGDIESGSVYPGPSALTLVAILVGPSSDQAASWALSMKQQQNASDGYIYSALADGRSVTPVDYHTQTPAPPLWYFAHGTRTLFARTDWTPNAFWGVFSSSPQLNSDHHHFAATNMVFTRGSDHLIVDPSNYGESGSLETNAVSADSPQVTGTWAPSQTTWSDADLPWARATAGGVYAARGDFAKAFGFNGGLASDIPYAHREWVMLPEGEVVTIDRVQTKDAAHFMYVNYHALTGGTLTINGNVATGTSGASKVAIHGVQLGGGTPAITHPSTKGTGNYPCGSCTEGRFTNDNYGVKVPGPWAVAIHVIDGLGSSEAAAQVGSLNDSNFDPAPAQNGGVIGAAVYRGTKQSYVVASSAQRGVSPATMTYGVPGTSAARHVVFDAPEASDGHSTVTAAVQGSRCVVSITAGTAGAGMMGHPLMFSVAAAANGCTVSEETNVPAGVPPPGGGVTPTPGTGGTSGGTAGASGGTAGSSGTAGSTGGIAGASGGTGNNTGSGGTGGSGNSGAGLGNGGATGNGGAGGPKGDLTAGPVTGGCGCSLARDVAPTPLLAVAGFAATLLLRARRRRR